MTEQPPEATPPDYVTFTVAQVADILQLSTTAVQTRARNGSWPHLRIGPRTIRFTPAHLDTIITTTEATPPERSTRRRTRRNK